MQPLLLSCLILAFLPLSASGEVGSPEETSFEEKLISSGANRPGDHPRRELARSIVLQLDAGRSREELPEVLDQDEGPVQEALDYLLSEEIVKEDPSGTLVPHAMVIRRADGERLYQVVEETAREVARVLREHRVRFDPVVARIRGLRRHSLDTIRFFLYSNVALDALQIRNVEAGLFGRPRTPRAGKHYFLSYQERVAPEREAFGIYGNHVNRLGPWVVGVYGNRRHRHPLACQALQDMMGRRGEDETLRLLESYARWTRSPLEQLDPTSREGLETLGLMEAGLPRALSFTRDDFQELEALAAASTEDLLAVLAASLEGFRQEYRSSRYASRVSFQEYYLWAYHFLYTRATDLLTPRPFRVPETGTVPYLVRIEQG